MVKLQQVYMLEIRFGDGKKDMQVFRIDSVSLWFVCCARRIYLICLCEWRLIREGYVILVIALCSTWLPFFFFFWLFVMPWKWCVTSSHCPWTQLKELRKLTPNVRPFSFFKFTSTFNKPVNEVIHNINLMFVLCWKHENTVDLLHVNRPITFSWYFY